MPIPKNENTEGISMVKVAVISDNCPVIALQILFALESASLF